MTEQNKDTLSQSMLECVKATARQRPGTDVSKSEECQKFASVR